MRAGLRGGCDLNCGSFYQKNAQVYNSCLMECTKLSAECTYMPRSGINTLQATSGWAYLLKCHHAPVFVQSPIP